MNATRLRPAREEGTLEGDRNGDAVVDNGFCGDGIETAKGARGREAGPRGLERERVGARLNSSTDDADVRR